MAPEALWRVYKQEPANASEMFYKYRDYKTGLGKKLQRLFALKRFNCQTMVTI